MDNSLKISALHHQKASEENWGILERKLKQKSLPQTIYYGSSWLFATRIVQKDRGTRKKSDNQRYSAASI